MVQEKITKNNIVWQLPMGSVEHNSTGYVHGNAKPHAFVVYDDEKCERFICVRNTINVLTNMKISTLKRLMKSTYVKSAGTPTKS